MQIVVIIPNTNNHDPHIKDRWYVIQDFAYARWCDGEGSRFFTTRQDNLQLYQYAEIVGVNSDVLGKCRWSKYTVTTQQQALQLGRELGFNVQQDVVQ